VNTENSARLALGVSTGAGAGSTVENMTIASSGNVGIGNATPGYKLTVAGPVRATQFIGDVNTYSTSSSNPAIAGFTGRKWNP